MALVQAGRDSGAFFRHHDGWVAGCRRLLEGSWQVGAGAVCISSWSVRSE